MHWKAHSILAAIIVVLACASCKRESRDAASPEPATAPASRSLAASGPTAAVFAIGDRTIRIARPCAAEQAGPPFHLLLFSDPADPGPEFYFDLPMDARLADGAEISFEQEARSSERQNDLIGIDLPDQTLQPESLSITARLAGEGLIHVQISGRFWLYKADAEQPDGRVPVRAEFDARIVPGKQ